MTAIVKHADKEEERAGGDAVGEHLENSALHADGTEGKDAEDHEAQVADGRVSHELLQVRLNERDQGAVDDADDGENGDLWRGLARCVRKKRQAETHHTVGAHLEKDARQDDGACGRRLNVGVGEPRVQGEERYLDGEGHKERQKKQPLGGGRKYERTALQSALDFDQVERAGGVIQPEASDQHQGGAGHGVQHELDGGVDASLMAPDADQESHRDQHDFPEEEEQEQVERQEYSHHADLEHQQHHEKFLDAMVDARPGGKYGDGCQEGGKNDQPQAQAVYPHVVVDRRRGDPGNVEFKFVAGRAEGHAGDQEKQRQQELERADDERHAPDIGMVIRAQNHQRQCAQSGEEHQNGQQVVAGRNHLVTMPIMGLRVGQKTMRMITSAPTTTHVA